MNFVKDYAKLLLALVIALIVLWYVLSLAKKLPGVAGKTAEKLGGLASGQEYDFKA